MKSIKQLEFKVCGQKIAVKTSELDEELVTQISTIVQQKLHQAEKRGKNMAPHYVMLLALLEMTQNYVNAKKSTTEYKKMIREKVNSLTTLLDQKHFHSH